MGLFGRKKEQNNEPVENKANNGISDEMKIILAAREEEKQEKIEDSRPRRKLTRSSFRSNNRQRKLPTGYLTAVLHPRG